MDDEKLQEAFDRAMDALQEFADWIEAEDQREQQTQQLRDQREQEQWKLERSLPLILPPNHRDVRPVYHRRLERGRNGSYLDRRG